MPERLVTDEALDRVDADALVELRAVAGRFARVVADATHARRQRIRFGQQPPRLFVVARFGVEQPALDVLARRASVIARWQAIDIDRAHGAPRARVVGQARTRVERDRKRLLHCASSASSSRPKRLTLRSASAWICATRSGATRRLEQVREAGLRLQVLLDRQLPPDLRDVLHLAVFGLEDREQRGLLREAGHPDGLRGAVAPAERAGHQHVDVARAAELHRAPDLGFEVAEFRHGRGRDVGNLVSHRDQRQVLALAEARAGRFADRHRRVGARGRRRRGRALHAGVHVRLVVVAEVQHVVVALEHAREAAEADVGGAAVAALRHHAHVALALHAQRRGDSRPDGGRIAEQRVNPRNLPRGLGVRRREHLEAARRVRRDELSIRRRHGGVDRVARAERLAAPLARAVPGVQRVGALAPGLHGALLLRQQPVADGEGAGLVEADGLVAHAWCLIRSSRRPRRGP